MYVTLRQILPKTGFPCILENNQFIFPVLEMSWNFPKSGNVLEEILPVKNIHLEQNSQCINIIAVEENFDCRRKRVDNLDTPC